MAELRAVGNQASVRCGLLISTRGQPSALMGWPPTSTLMRPAARQHLPMMQFGFAELHMVQICKCTFKSQLLPSSLPCLNVLSCLAAHPHASGQKYQL